MVANLFDFHYINYRFRSTEDLNCAIYISLTEEFYMTQKTVQTAINRFSSLQS